MEMVRKTIENDEKYLRMISEEVDLSDKTYLKDVKLLERFCLEHECFALAAIQIGIPKRIIYLKNTTSDIPLEDITYNESQVLINPVVVFKRGLTMYWEACVSCLDNMGLVKRPYKVGVNFYDANGTFCNKVFEGLGATVVCHEIDHLDGILHMDIAEKVLVKTQEERKAYRKEHPYNIIAEDGDFDELRKCR